MIAVLLPLFSSFTLVLRSFSAYYTTINKLFSLLTMRIDQITAFNVVV